MKIYNSILDLIGSTPMLRLGKITKGLKNDILVKIEYYNPSGSIKDRIALEMIENAEKQGLIHKGYTIVEPTSGNTGTSLAFVCALKGYPMIAVMPENMSDERKKMIAAFGSKLELVPCIGNIPGKFTKEDLEATVAKAEELANQPMHYMPNQFANPSNTIAHQKTTAKEIWEATGGKIDAFVAGVGTGGTTMGVSHGLKERNPDIKVYVVEPANSAVILGEEAGPHRIQGIGEGFIPDLIEREFYDGIVKVSDDEAKGTACRLVRLEGIFGGYSAGANVFASLKVAKELGENKTIVSIIADTGMKYLSTDLFHHDSAICSRYCCNIEQGDKPADCMSSSSRCCAFEPCY